LRTTDIDRAFFKAIQIHPKLGNHGRFCPAGLHGQPVLKYPKKFNFFKRDAQRIPEKWNKHLTSTWPLASWLQ
jgi:hypothetical protein